jgi:hypothetical protein
MVRYTTEISRDGPYIRVLLRDVLPPDWQALRRALEAELEEGANRVHLVLGECAACAPEDPEFVRLGQWLRQAGVDVVTVQGGGNARAAVTT